MPDGPKVIIAAGTATIGVVFGGILLTRCFLNCRNRSSNCITWQGNGYLRTPYK